MIYGSKPRVLTMGDLLLVFLTRGHLLPSVRNTSSPWQHLALMAPSNS